MLASNTYGYGTCTLLKWARARRWRVEIRPERAETALFLSSSLSSSEYLIVNVHMNEDLKVSIFMSLKS